MKINPYRNFTISRILILMVLLSVSVYPQDSTKSVTGSDTAYKPLKFILSDHNYLYMNPSQPDTITRKRFLWYPTKSFEDVFNYLPGYYQSYMDVGQLNLVSFNQIIQFNNIVLRHGRSIADLIDGSVDYNLLSRNEVDEIEVSNGFGNNIYSALNSVNIIQRQLFQNRPYTEISYYQDRYENLYFDGNFHQNLFRNLNFNFGITKHSYEGHYVNSDFDKWLGRFNLNFAPSGKLNMFAYVNYAKIQKGLNEGINSDTVNIGNKPDMFNSSTAIVNNPDSYEKKERFDIDIGGVLLAGKSSFTKLQLYVSNSFREYRDEENRPDPNGIFIQKNYHWINYGADLKERLRISPFKNTTLISNSQISYELSISQLSSEYYRKDEILRFIQELELLFKNVSVSGYLKGYSYKGNRMYHFSGIMTQYRFDISSKTRLDLRGEFNSKYDYLSTGFTLSNGENSISSDFFVYDDSDFNSEPPKGVNTALNLRLFKIDFKGNYTYNVVPENLNILISGKKFAPEHFGSIMISWHDMAFKNKLEYNIGLSTRFWSEYNSKYYSSLNNYLEIPYFGIEKNDEVAIPSNATLDFFIMGKIGKATFGITLENILDRLIYNTGVYPFMDRGGLVNAISRFNVTWNFFD